MEVIMEISDKILEFFMFDDKSFYIYALFVCIPSAFEFLYRFCVSCIKKACFTNQRAMHFKPTAITTEYTSN